MLSEEGDFQGRAGKGWGTASPQGPAWGFGVRSGGHCQVNTGVISKQTATALVGLKSSPRAERVQEGKDGSPGGKGAHGPPGQGLCPLDLGTRRRLC